MRGMKREIGKKKKQRLVLVIIIALIVAVISRFVVPVSLDRWKGFIFFALFIASSLDNSDIYGIIYCNFRNWCIFRVKTAR